MGGRSGGKEQKKKGDDEKMYFVEASRTEMDATFYSFGLRATTGQSAGAGLGSHRGCHKGRRGDSLGNEQGWRSVAPSSGLCKTPACPGEISRGFQGNRQKNRNWARWKRGLRCRAEHTGEKHSRGEHQQAKKKTGERKEIRQLFQEKG